MIFGIVVFLIEEQMLHARETVWIIVLAYGLMPLALVCRLFGIHDLGAAGALNQWSTYALVGNAFLYCAPVALGAWLITKRRKQ